MKQACYETNMLRNKPDSYGLLGRDEILDALWCALEELAGAVLVGPRRIGKSEVLKYMARHPKGNWRAMRIDLEGVTGLPETAELIERVLAEAGLGASVAAQAMDQVGGVNVAGVGVTRERCAEKGPWEQIDGIVARAQNSLPDGVRLALLLDEVPWWLDELRKRVSPAEVRTALARLRSMRQRDRNPVAMVLTGSVGLTGVAREAGAIAELNDVLPPLEIGPLDDVAGETLFETELLGRNRTCDRAAASRGHAATGGSPHWIKVLVTRVGGQGMARVQDVEDAVDALLSRRLRDLFEDEGRGHFRRRHLEEDAVLLMAMLAEASAEEGANEASLLAAATSLSSRPSRERAEWALNTLVDEFYLDEVDGRFRFINPLLRRWWERWGGRR